MNTFKEKPQFSNNYFSWDALTSGGLSIIFCFLMWAFFDRSASLLTISQLAFTMAFVVNHPHFLSSYVLLYHDFKKSIFTQPRYFFSAIIVPLVLILSLVIGLTNPQYFMMSHIITAMFVLVGWHYVKQVFGFVIVSSAQRKIFFSKNERSVLLINLFLIWLMSILVFHTGTSDFTFYGIKHYSLALPAWTLTVTYFLVAITFLMVIFQQVQKYAVTGIFPAPPAVSAFVAIYFWYLPVISHPGFAYFIPFFHSLQYLGFVLLLKKNQINDEVKPLSGKEQRELFIKKFMGFAGASLGLGALAFHFIPNGLDSLGLKMDSSLGSTPFLVSFLLFINIHHYFIDNTIWRSQNEVVKKYLFDPPP